MPSELLCDGSIVCVKKGTETTTDGSPEKLHWRDYLYSLATGRAVDDTVGSRHGQGQPGGVRGFKNSLGSVLNIATNASH